MQRKSWKVIQQGETNKRLGVETEGGLVTIRDLTERDLSDLLWFLLRRKFGVR